MSQLSLPSPVAPSFPPLAYQGLPVLTTEMLAQAYEVETHQVRQNFKNNRERFAEGKHFFTVTNGELKEFRLQVESFYSQISPKVRSLTLWTERGAARHAKMLNSDRAWDVFELLEETFFAVVKPASALPATLQSELHALVDAKLSAFPRAIQGRARSEIWARFNRHFKIARYAQLPPARMPEARDYLIEMEVRALAGLPASAPLPAPKQDNAPAWDEMPMPADMDKRRARICRELYELQEKFGMLVNDIRICLHPGGRLLRLPPELDNAYETLAALNRVATGGAYTARQAIYSAYQIGKGLKFV